MAEPRHASRASWTLIDQGIVSLGNFVLAITLARSLSQADYGTYALLFGAFMAVQLITTSLVFYPLSVLVPNTKDHEQYGLLSASVALLVAICVPICVLMAIVLVQLGRSDIMMPAVLAFSLWQLQEVLRRCLMSQFRHRSAIIGDAISYLGQAAVFVIMVRLGYADLRTALLSMAFTSAAGAAVQALQIGLVLPDRKHLSQLIRGTMSIGGWSLGNNFMIVLRHQIPMWVLATMLGPLGTAPYQAIINIVNVTNPMIFGLSNIIPPTAAAAKAKGLDAAWRASRIYGLLGAPLAFGYYALAFTAPQMVLVLFYGADSPYTGHDGAARLILAAWCLSYTAEVVCAFLFGLRFGSQAFAINSAGTLTVAVLAFPLAAMFGVSGVCIAVLGAHFMLAAASYATLRRVLAGNTKPLLDFEAVSQKIRVKVRHVIG
jgi:O-antigen/teichoic acid export membrane protein